MTHAPAARAHPAPLVLVGIDWGTTTLRSYAFDANGHIAAERSLAMGVMQLPPGGFAEAFDRACGDWLSRQPDLPVLACGMVGSAQGWHPAPYRDVPASLPALAAGLTPSRGRGSDRLHIVPGLRLAGPPPDMMRGEETQIVGALARLQPGNGEALWIGLPGSHCKWARVDDGAIRHFDTFMTGEVFAALRSATILGRTMAPGGLVDDDAFLRGVACARSPGGRGLLSDIFSARSLCLDAQLPQASAADYLSGLLIGHELAGLGPMPRQGRAPDRVVLVGGKDLCRRYALALRSMGAPEPQVLGDTAAEGLWAIAQAAGLVEAPGPSRGPSGAPAASAPSAPPLLSSSEALARALAECGLVAILRGLRPDEAVTVGLALHAAGMRVIEVPLNSPSPFESIAALRAALPPDCVVGAGTVLDPADCERVAESGGSLIVMPHADPAVIRRAKAGGLACAAGVATPTEAFAALAAGADLLKLFPADSLGPATLKAWRAVLPTGVPLVPVGGVTPDSVAAWVDAGAAACGLGSALYRPGDTPTAVRERARAFVQAWQHAHP